MSLSSGGAWRRPRGLCQLIEKPILGGLKPSQNDNWELTAECSFFYCRFSSSFGLSGGGVVAEGSGFHAMALAGGGGVTPQNHTQKFIPSFPHHSTIPHSPGGR